MTKTQWAKSHPGIYRRSLLVGSERTLAGDPLRALEIKLNVFQGAWRAHLSFQEEGVATALAAYTSNLKRDDPDSHEPPLREAERWAAGELRSLADRIEANDV